MSQNTLKNQLSTGNSEFLTTVTATILYVYPKLGLYTNKVIQKRVTEQR